MVGVIDLAAVWNRTRDSAEVPRPSVFERLLRAAGLPVVAAAAYATLGALIVRRSGKRLRLDLGEKRQCGALAEHDPAEDLDLEQRRAPIRSKGGDTEFVYWDTGDRAPAAPAAAPARRHVAHQRAAVPGQPQARPGTPPRAPRHLPAHRPGTPRLRGRADWCDLRGCGVS